MDARFSCRAGVRVRMGGNAEMDAPAIVKTGDNQSINILASSGVTFSFLIFILHASLALSV